MTDYKGEADGHLTGLRLNVRRPYGKRKPACQKIERDFPRKGIAYGK